MVTNGVNNLRCLNVTHIYKFKGTTDHQTKFCNVIPKQRHLAIAKDEKSSYIIVKEDIVDRKWLKELVVNSYGCQGWWNLVNNNNTLNIMYALPVSSVSASSLTKPVKDNKAPELLFPQESIGTCGISAFDSAFAYYFDRPLGAQILLFNNDYMKALSTPNTTKSKKSEALKFLSRLMNQKTYSQKYKVRRMTNMISWKELNRNTVYFNSIMTCILKSSNMSKENMIGISNGWIFDANLDYGILLNEKKLNWCTGYHEFIGFYEQLQFEKKITNKKQKKKKKIII